MGTTTISEMTDAGALAGTEIVEVSKLSTTVTKTGTTLSAQASDNSYNDSANEFISKGFAVGNRVRVMGFTGNVANNIYVAKITALTAGKMTIGGTDGDVIVDDAAGESVTISKWESHRTTMAAIGEKASGAARKVVQMAVTDPNSTSSLSTGDGQAYLVIPSDFNGMNLVDAQAAVSTVSSSGLPTIQIANVTDGVDMLSTKITIDANERTSYTAATPAVIDTTKDDVVTGDLLRIDVDVAGTGAKGLVVILTFQLP